MLYIFTFLTCIATDCVYVCTYSIHLSKQESPCQSGATGHSGLLDSLPGSATTLWPKLGKVVVMFRASAAPGVFSIQIISCSGSGTHLCLGDISTARYDDTKVLKWDLVKLETRARRPASVQQGRLLTLISSAEKGYSKLRTCLPACTMSFTYLYRSQQHGQLYLTKMHCYYTNNSIFWAPTYFTDVLQILSGSLEAHIFKKCGLT